MADCQCTDCRTATILRLPCQVCLPQYAYAPLRNPSSPANPQDSHDHHNTGQPFPYSAHTRAVKGGSVAIADQNLLSTGRPVSTSSPSHLPSLQQRARGNHAFHAQLSRGTACKRLPFCSPYNRYRPRTMEMAIIGNAPEIRCWDEKETIRVRWRNKAVLDSYQF